MASIVKSVEYVECTWDNTSDGSQNLSKGQDETQCVPFWSVQMVSGGLPDEWNERCHAIDIYDNAGTAAVRVIRGGQCADVDDRKCGVFVVEFESTINVQKVAFTLATGDATDNVTITDVGAQTQAFAILTYDYDDGGSNYDAPERACIRLSWNGASTTSMTLTRDNSGGACDGWLYVVDCDSGEFTVDWDTWTPTTGYNHTSAPDEHTITSTVLADSFLIVTYEATEGGDDPRDGSSVSYLSDTTTITSKRGAATDYSEGTTTITAQVVECQNNEWDVQRGTITMTTTPETDTITGVTQANSIVKTGCHGASVYDLGSSSFAAGTLVLDNSCLVKFNSSTEITSIRETDGETGNIVPYEVIDFTGEVGGSGLTLGVLANNAGF